MEQETMIRNHFARSALSLGIAMALFYQGPDAIAQQPEVEEVIVTGSYIRRSEGFQSASSLTQMTAEDLAVQGTVNMGEIVDNLNMNQGSSITNTTQGTSDSNTTFNLRGLGTSSTLQLMDGIRTLSDNVNLILPGIAIERMDIVADGAAALYGSEAVAGVVNVVPIKNYEGMRLEYFHEVDDKGDFDDKQFSFLSGTNLTNDVNLVIAGEYRDSGELHRTERPELLRAGFTTSTTSNPANYVVPMRDANGMLTGETQRLPDPNCGEEREDPAVRGNNPRGFVWDGTCRYEFGDSRGYRQAQTRSNLYSNLTIDVSSDLTLSAQATYSRLLVDNFGSPSNPGGRVEDLPVVRGELPGNTFRAVDGNGNPLFARDADGNSIPDRDADGNVILDPNGIPFNEDVRITGWRPLGKHGTIPSQYPDDGSYFPGETDNRIWRVTGRADFTVPMADNWDGTLMYMGGQFINRSRTNNPDFASIEQGLNCDVLNDRDHCFNPFVSVDPSTLTPQHVMDAIAGLERVDNTYQLQTLDAIFNGTLPLGDFTLPGGEIGAAVGYQRREEQNRDIPGLSEIKGENFAGVQQDPVFNRRSVNAYFGELLIPVLPDLELNLALRREEFSTGQSSTDPKVGVVYQPTNWLSLQGTAGTAFIAPTLNQLTAPIDCGSTNMDDPYTTFASFVRTCRQGNPNLVPESSNNYALGFTLTPMDDMELQLTWNRTEFEDRIVNTSARDIIDADFFNFQQATGFTPTEGNELPSLDAVRSWMNDPRSDPRIERNPNNIEELINIQVGASNATRMDVDSWDLQFSYRFPVPFVEAGELDLGINGTYISSYEYQLGPNKPVVEGAGRQNSDTGAVPALPERKANARFSWLLDNHTVNLTVRYWSSISFDAFKFPFQQFLPFSNYREIDRVKAWTQADIIYSYRGLQAFNGTMDLSLGARNMFDRAAQKSPMNGGVIGELHDPLGRAIYGRVSYQF